MTTTEMFVIAGIPVAGILVQVGIYLQTSRSNVTANKTNADAIAAITTEVVAQGKDISKIKGFLGLNGGGENGYQRGKGHHV